MDRSVDADANGPSIVNVAEAALANRIKPADEAVVAEDAVAEDAAADSSVANVPPAAASAIVDVASTDDCVSPAVVSDASMVVDIALVVVSDVSIVAGALSADACITDADAVATADAGATADTGATAVNNSFTRDEAAVVMAVSVSVGVIDASFAVAVVVDAIADVAAVADDGAKRSKPEDGNFDSDPS